MPTGTSITTERKRKKTEKVIKCHLKLYQLSHSFALRDDQITIDMLVEEGKKINSVLFDVDSKYEVD